MENNIKQPLKEEEAKKMLQDLMNSHDMSLLEEMIKDNKIEFKHNDTLYRVRLLTGIEREELNDLRSRKFAQLFKDKDILLEKDWKLLYKERGIDIQELEEQISKLEQEKKSYNMKLGEALSSKIDKAILMTYRNNIVACDEQIRILVIKKSNLLVDSLENKLFDYVTQVMTYLVLDIKIGDDWKKAFPTFEEFRNCLDEKLIAEAAYRTMLIQYTF
jgi:hypothetical protein